MKSSQDTSVLILPRECVDSKRLAGTEHTLPSCRPKRDFTICEAGWTRERGFSPNPGGHTDHCTRVGQTRISDALVVYEIHRAPRVDTTGDLRNDGIITLPSGT